MRLSLLFRALKCGIKFVKRKDMPASITCLCHKYLITTLGGYCICSISVDTYRISKFSYSQLLVSVHKNPVSVGSCHALLGGYKHNTPLFEVGLCIGKNLAIRYASQYSCYDTMIYRYIAIQEGDILIKNFKSCLRKIVTVKRTHHNIHKI